MGIRYPSKNMSGCLYSNQWEGSKKHVTSGGGGYTFVGGPPVVDQLAVLHVANVPGFQVSLAVKGLFGGVLVPDVAFRDYGC